MSDYLAAIPLSDVKSFLNITEYSREPRRLVGTRSSGTQFEGVERYLDRPCRGSAIP